MQTLYSMKYSTLNSTAIVNYDVPIYGRINPLNQGHYSLILQRDQHKMEICISEPKNYFRLISLMHSTNHRCNVTIFCRVNLFNSVASGA